MVNDLSLQHTITAVPTDALGRTVTYGLLMAYRMQDGQIVPICMNGMLKSGIASETQHDGGSVNLVEGAMCIN